MFQDYLLFATMTVFEIVAHAQEQRVGSPSRRDASVAPYQRARSALDCWSADCSFAQAVAGGSCRTMLMVRTSGSVSWSRLFWKIVSTSALMTWSSVAPYVLRTISQSD